MDDTVSPLVQASLSRKKYTNRSRRQRKIKYNRSRITGKAKYPSSILTRVPTRVNKPKNKITKNKRVVHTWYDNDRIWDASLIDNQRAIRFFRAFEDWIIDIASVQSSIPTIAQLIESKDIWLLNDVLRH